GGGDGNGPESLPGSFSLRIRFQRKLYGFPLVMAQVQYALTESFDEKGIGGLAGFHGIILPDASPTCSRSPLCQVLEFSEPEVGLRPSGHGILEHAGFVGSEHELPVPVAKVGDIP